MQLDGLVPQLELEKMRLVRYQARQFVQHLDDQRLPGLVRENKLRALGKHAQAITHGDQEAFSRRFGPFAEDAYTRGVPGHPDVQPVIKEKAQKIGLLFGAGWHTDSAFLPEPPAISMLYSVEIPPYGGDTIWANSALAYATLSETMKRMLAPLRVHMSMANVVANAQKYQQPDETPLKYVIDAIGDDRLVFSTDFPHGDSKFPRAVESFLELPIAEESKRKILWDNCAAYYGLPA